MEIPKVNGRQKEIGSIDYSEGIMKRFVCYCPKCSGKILWSRGEMGDIVRHLQKRYLVDKKIYWIKEIKEGIFKSLKYKRIKVVDTRVYNKLATKRP